VCQLAKSASSEWAITV